ncbi:CHAP domain-containing protein [Latilactobacillus curvatus]|nr:CHAP domain-containing protein [Latilactobacillus curvatus]MDG2985857.1 CHAP domain-containing protein [Latilactobacillus curvatus]
MSMMAVSVLNTVSVNAATVDDTQKAISNNKSETAKLLKDIASANAENIKLQQEITANSAKIEKTKTDIDQSNQKIEKLNEQIKSAKAEVAKRTTTLKAQLVALQKQTGDTVSGNVYFDFMLNSKDFSDLISRSFTVNKLNQASKEALNDVKEAKAQYSDLMDQQQATKADLQSDKESLESQQNDLKAMKTKSDQQQDALNKKINDNKSTLVALQTQYAEAASALKVANDKAKETKATKTVEVAKAKTTSDKSESVSASGNSQAISTSKIESSSSSKSESLQPDNNSGISQGDGSSHGSVAGNSYDWGQCTWYVKQVAPWAGNNWGNGGQWGSSAAAAGFRVDHTPSAGAIIVFLPGQSVGGQWTADPSYGHVGYVESVSGNSVTFSQGGMGFSNPAGPNTATLSNGGSYIYIHR